MSPALELPAGFVVGQRDCGVLATATLTGTPYATVWDHFKATTRKRKSWTGWLFTTEVLAALKHFGAKVIGAKPPGRPTIVQFADRHTINGATYLIRTSDHFLVLRDGIALDNGHIPVTPVADHSTRRKRVLDAWEIRL